MNRFNSAISWLLLSWFFPIFLVKDVEGRENFSKKRNFILASNHLSHLDWLIGCYLCVPRKYTFIGQVDEMAGFKGFCRDLMYGFGGVIPVDRNDKESKKRATQKAIEMLKKRYNLFIYPEGTRSRDGKLHEFKHGVGKLYLETGVPILPVATKGTYELMPPGGGLHLRRTVEVIIGKPLEFPEKIKLASGLDKNSEKYKQLCGDIAKRTEKEVRKLLER
jgi:1-acyl-sn-glycerol-3-phosphate acyltransferase